MGDDVDAMSVAELVAAVGGPNRAAELVSRMWAGDPRYAMAMACEPSLRPKVTSNDGFLHLDLLIIDGDEWLQNGGASPASDPSVK